MYLRAHWIPGQPGMTRKGKQPPKKSLKCRRSRCPEGDLKRKYGKNVEGPIISSGTFSIRQMPDRDGHDAKASERGQKNAPERKCERTFFME